MECSIQVANRESLEEFRKMLSEEFRCRVYFIYNEQDETLIETEVLSNEDIN